MSREVKIYDMPDEKKESLMDSMLAKVIATLIASLLVIVIGQGLVIWKNQDAFETSIEELEKDIEETHDISERLIRLESHKVEAFSRIDKLEGYTEETLVDRSQRGGSYRRNDADAMKEYLLEKIDIANGKISALEHISGNIEDKLEECRMNIPSYALKVDLKEVETELEELEEEFENSYDDLAKRCEEVIEILEEGK